MRPKSLQATLTQNSCKETKAPRVFTEAEQHQADLSFFTAHYIAEPEMMWHAISLMGTKESLNALGLAAQLFPEATARVLAEVMPPDCLF